MTAPKEMWAWTPEAASVLGDVKRAAATREAHLGAQELPDSWGGWLEAYDDRATALRRINLERVRRGDLSWDGVLLEATYRALAEHDDTKRRYLLVELAAAAVTYVGKLDRRAALEAELKVRT